MLYPLPIPTSLDAGSVLLISNYHCMFHLLSFLPVKPAFIKNLCYYYFQLKIALCTQPEPLNAMFSFVCGSQFTPQGKQGFPAKQTLGYFYREKKNNIKRH